MGELTATVFVISAPSGAGKTSLITALLQKHVNLSLSVSYTTRPMRPGEKEGEHYHFIDEVRYQAMQAAGEFIEGAQVFGHYYGTAKHSVMKMLEAGHDVVLEIDWQGAEQIRKIFPQAVSIFVVPPSKQALEERLHKRQQDNEAVIERRMAEAHEAVQRIDAYDYIVVNDTFGHALAELELLVAAARLRTSVQKIRQNTLLESF